jgi:hypothetical protein
MYCPTVARHERLEAKDWNWSTFGAGTFLGPAPVLRRHGRVSERGLRPENGFLFLDGSTARGSSAM